LGVPCRAGFVYARATHWAGPLTGGTIERRKRVTQRQAFPKLTVLIAIVAAAALLAGCAAKKAPEAFWGDPETGLILEYRMPEEPLTYEMISTFLQSMDMGGQTVDTKSTSMTTMSIASRGAKNGDLMLTVTLEDASVGVDAPGAGLEADMSEAIGKSFEMTLSALGEEKDLPDPNSIQYDLGLGGKRSAISSVQMMFPDLPGRPVKVGDSWTTVDGFTEEGGGGNMTISFETVNTLVGFETVNGMECAKIEALYQGTIEGSGAEGPAEWESEGEIEGVSTWYFAYKKGVLVSDAMEGTGTADVVAQTPQGEMKIPTMQDISAETKLIK
jgi:hypothetical protein